MPKEKNIEWEAKEYIPGKKNTSWYVVFGIICLVLIIISFLLSSWSFAVVIIVSAIALVVFSIRPARVLHYSLTNKGLSEENKFYSYDTFKSFGVLKEDDNFSIVLTPKKRFSLSVKVYFPKQYGEVIVDFLGARLPMDEVRLDLLDMIVKVLRF